MSNLRGLGDEAPDGWAVVEESVQLPKGKKALMDTISEILSKTKVQWVHVELGKPINFARFVPESEASQVRFEEEASQHSIGAIIRNLTMEEVDAVKESGGYINRFVLTEMFLAVSLRSLHVTHIGMGSETRFFEWMQWDSIKMGGITHYCGARLSKDSEIPNDVLILVCGPRPGDRLDQAVYCLKCSMPMEEYDEQGTDGSNAGRRDLFQGSGTADGTVADDAGGVGGEGGGVRPEEDSGAEGTPGDSWIATVEGDRPRHQEDHEGLPDGGAAARRPGDAGGEGGS
jgi:hypothetical protein